MQLETTRRGFLIGVGAALAAPAIVRAESIMPVRAIVEARTRILRLHEGFLGGTVFIDVTDEIPMQPGGGIDIPNGYHTYRIEAANGGNLIIPKNDHPDVQRIRWVSIPREEKDLDPRMLC